MQYPVIDQDLESEIVALATCLIRRRRPRYYRSFLRAGARLADAAKAHKHKARRWTVWPVGFLPQLAWIFRWIGVGLLLFHTVFLGFVIVASLTFKLVNPGTTAFMVYRTLVDGQKMLRPLYIPLNEIPRSTVHAFVYLEDHDFYTHHGINPQAIKEAAERNARYKRTVFGGSTITQQLARNLFLPPDRTWLRKYLELYASLILEGVLGKDRIMELYLNYIEFGRGAFGLGRGAYYQFGRPFSNLSWDERNRLAVIITSPLRYTVDNFMGQPGMAARYYALSE